MMAQYPHAIKRKFLAQAFKHKDYIKNSDFILTDLLFSNEEFLIYFLTSNLPTNQNLIENMSILSFLFENSLLFPCFIDPADLIAKTLKDRFSKKENLYAEYLTVDDKTFENIEESLEKEGMLIVKDPDESLLQVIKPIIELRWNKVLEKSYAKVKKNEPCNIIFNEKTINFSSNFRLVLIFTDEKIAINNFIKQKMILLNNDIEDKEIFEESMLDLIIKKEIKYEEDNFLKSFIQEKSNSTINAEYKSLIGSLKKMLTFEIKMEVNIFNFLHFNY